MSDTDGAPFTLNTKELDKFRKALKESENLAVHIGVLGDKNHRNTKPNTELGSNSNAEVGMKHEFGIGVPERSFLRVPLQEHLMKALKESNALDKDVLRKVVKEASIREWLTKIGIVGEGVVTEGFASNGYGKWAPHAPGYTNNTGMILVDTQQLRNSITSEVKA